MIIYKTNYKIIVTNLEGNRFEIKRVSRGREITMYAKRKDVDEKIDLLSLKLEVLKRRLGIC